MTMDAVELRMHRINTKAFIDIRPTTIVLQPKTERVRTPSGGWKDADAAPREPQVFRIIELGAQLGRPQVKLQDGTLREVFFQLLGEHDAAIAIDDEWTADDGRQWIVADVKHDNEYEMRASVVERGR